MGDPVSLGIGAVGLGAVSAGSSIFSGFQESRAADRQSKRLKAVGRLRAQDIREETRSAGGAQRAASRSNTGSALDIQLDTAVQGELAALREQLGFQTQAKEVSRAGQQALTSSIFQGGTTLLGSSLQALALNPAGGGSNFSSESIFDPFGTTSIPNTLIG